MQADLHIIKKKKGLVGKDSKSSHVREMPPPPADLFSLLGKTLISVLIKLVPLNH